MKSQLERVRQRLHQRGRITRNECLSTFPAITRLGARIIDLRNEGYTFDTKKEPHDYVYVLVSKPAPKQMQML